jgi:hypothetical protein
MWNLDIKIWFKLWKQVKKACDLESMLEFGLNQKKFVAWNGTRDPELSCIITMIV